jgi:tetratricopeptide (TPR) repeat protein
MRPIVVPALLLTLINPLVVVAQGAASLSARTEKAAMLIAQAESLFRTAELPQRARLFEEAAELLPETDPRSSRALRRAGEVHYQLRNPARAMALMEKSAEAAAARGAVTEAADAYVAALLVALELNARAQARKFIDRAISLTSSPVMPETDRQRILRRISQPAAALGVRPAAPTEAHRS